MNLNQLATGVLSGYVSKALQLGAALVLVPFLLDPDVLGVEDYGRAFAIVGMTGIFSIAVVGIHFSADRAIAQAVGRHAEQGGLGINHLLGSTTKVLSLISLAYVGSLLIFDTTTLGWIGIPPDPQYRAALLAAGAISFLENALYLVRSPLIARGDIAYVNLVGMLELAARTAAVFVIFTHSKATVATFFTIQAVFTLGRQIAFWARLDPSDRRGLMRAPMKHSLEAVRYAGPVSLAEGSTVLVRNVPVMLASRFLGATEAGFVAIVANTLQGYILQVFVAVFQPIAVPIASRLRLSQVTPSRLKRFLEIESAYGLGIAILFSQAILWTPRLIPLWLGTGFDGIVLATQIMIAGCGIQTSTLIRRSILIGHGALPAAVPIIAGSAVVSTILTAALVTEFHSWVGAIVIGTGHMIVSSSLGIDRVFGRIFGNVVTRIRVPHVVSVSSIFTLSWLIGQQFSSESFVVDLSLAVATLAGTALIGSMTIISLRTAGNLVAALYRVRGVDFLE